MTRDPRTGRLNWTTTKKCMVIGLAIIFLRTVLGIEIFPFSFLVGAALCICAMGLHQRALKAASK